MNRFARFAALATLAALPVFLNAAPVYLKQGNMTVSLGAGMSANPFANRGTAESLASIIDAPSAAASEQHNQQTHVWVSGGPLSLRFDLLVEYDLTNLHFWNYHSEGFDVDDIDFRFFDASNNLVGTLSNVAPQLGGTAPNDATLIFAETINLSFPSRVRFVEAVLTGSNNEVDFNNLGFTGSLSEPAPNPQNPASAPSTLLLALGAAVWLLRQRVFQRD